MKTSIGTWAYTIGPYADKPVDFDTVCAAVVGRVVPPLLCIQPNVQVLAGNKPIDDLDRALIVAAQGHIHQLFEQKVLSRTVPVQNQQ